MRTTSNVAAVLGLAVLIAPGSTFSPRSAARLHRPRALGVSVLQATTGWGEASVALAASQSETLAAIKAAIPELTPKPDLSWAPGAQTVAGAAAYLVAFDAPGPANVAWVSSLNIDGKHSSLTILNGPLTDVPHFVSRCVLKPDDTLDLFIDWRPRADGGYAMRKEDGSFPGPEELGREAFTYSSARAEMEKKFYTSELEAFCAATVASLQGGSPAGPSNEFDKATRGPLAVDLTGVPVTDANLAAVVQARAKAAEFWMGWQADTDAHLHRPGAPVNAQYVFDSPKKQEMYSALLETARGLYGDDGIKLAAADSGPLDEGYVGGGS